MPTFFVTTPNERPDFRTAIAFLWHDGQNVDTEGDSNNPASRTWTELYISNRERADETVEAFPYQNSPLILQIESDHENLAARLALFIATYCKGLVATSPDSEFLSPNTLLSRIGLDFESSTAFKRASESPFANSSLENPFPNLDKASMLKAKQALRL